MLAEELERRGMPHISYHDSTHYDLRYAYSNGHGWQVESVARIEGSTSIAMVFDSAGKLLVAYKDTAYRDLQYARELDLDHVVYLPLITK